MDGIPHPLKIRLSKQLGHGWSLNSGGLGYEDGMAALLVAAAIMAVMLAVVVQIHRFSAGRAVRIRRHFGSSHFRRTARHKLMPTLLTLIFLVFVNVFSVTIKVRFVVALWVAYLVSFFHEDSSHFGSTLCLW